MDVDASGALVQRTSTNDAIQKLWLSGGEGVAFDSRPRAWLREPDGSWTAGAEQPGVEMETSIVGSMWDDGERVWVAGFDGHVWRSPPRADLYESLRHPDAFRVR